MGKLITDAINFQEVKSDTYNEDIQKFISEISNNPYTDKIKTYVCEDKNIKLLLVTLELTISLPTKRRKMKVQIKEFEPIAIIIRIDEFPYTAPFIFSHREDFPSSSIPHLTLWWNAVANICLHRGNYDDWFLEHSTYEFISRIRSWFKDAACNKLIRPGDDFEPMLIQSDVCKLIYSYDKIVNLIEQYWNNQKGKGGYAFFLFKVNISGDNMPLITNENKEYAFQLIDIYSKSNFDKVIKEYKKMTSFKNNNYHIGIIAWPNKNNLYDEYINYLPNSLKELLEICTSLNINFNTPLNVLKNNVNLRASALILAIRRPTNLIGHSSNLELLNFGFVFQKIKKLKVETLNLNAYAFAIKQFEPMTKELAAYISNVELSLLEQKILTIGAGALGSKVLFHLVRNGFNNITIVDNDTLSPHNLVRHALTAESIGKNKATEIRNTLNQMFLSDNKRNFNASTFSFFKFAKNENLDNYDILLDFSASRSVSHFLSDYQSSLPKKIFRGELAYEGKLGFLLFEGINRSPSIEEMQVLLYRTAITNEEVSNWLIDFKTLKDRNGDAELEDIIIGLGCNTSTMKLSDEIVSYHATLFSNYIKNNIKVPNRNGKLLISYFNEDDYKNNYCNIIEIDSFIQVESPNQDWIVKISHQLYQNILNKLQEACPRETGGILLGTINYNKKIIYAIDTYTPEDSKFGLASFYKGSKGTREYLEDIIYKTGEMIIYVGDWHTHPNGSLSMSRTDETALSLQKEEVDDIKLPAHIMIFNNLSCRSYII